MLPEPHTIRLRGPWQIEPLERFVRCGDRDWQRLTDGLPAAARAKMPADWSGIFGPNFCGRVRFRRTFQKPTGLDEGQCVFLVVEPPRSSGVVRLGGEFLAVVRNGDPPGRFEITDRLVEHNQLEIVVEHPPLDDSGPANDDNTARLPGGLVGEVRLEIQE